MRGLMVCFLAAVLFSFGECYGQHNLMPFVIKGTISNKNISLKQIFITASYIDSNDIVFNDRKVPVIDRKFSFSGLIRYPHAVHLWYEDEADTIYLSTNNFFIEAGDQQVEITEDELVGITPKVIGSSVHDDFIKCYKPLLVEDAYNSSTTRMEHRKVNALRDSLLEDGYRNCDNHYIPVWIMSSAIHYSGYRPSYRQLYNNLSMEVRQSGIGMYLNRRLADLEKVAVGAHFPELNLLDTAGADVKFLIDGRNGSPYQSSRYTLIDFWFSTCGPCIGQFPEIKAMLSQYPAEIIKVLGITVDSRKIAEKWMHVIRQHSLTWQQLMDSGGLHAKRLRINSYPSNFLVDANGIIIARDLEISEVVDFLEKQVK